MNDPQAILADVRCFVDGELPSSRRAEMEQVIASSSQVRQAVEFEQQLRERVRVVMTDVATPDHLVAAVGTAARRRTPAGRAARPRRPQRANVLAIAACIALISGVVLISIFSPQIDEWGRPTASQLAAEVLRYAAGEHDRCLGDPARLRGKLSWGEREAATRLRSHLGRSDLLVPDLTELGYELIGAGKCQVPLADRSGHMIYARTTVGRRPPVVASIFVLPDDGAMESLPGGFAAGAWCRSDGETRVSAFRDGSVVYVLVCGDEYDRPSIEGRLAEALLGP